MYQSSQAQPTSDRSEMIGDLGIPFSLKRQAATAQKKKAKKSKKKDKEAASASVKQPTAESSSSKKRPAPETVLDPSVQISQKRQKIHPAPEKSAKSKSKKEKEDEEDFKDSRGTGPRTCCPLIFSSTFSYITQVVKRRKAGPSTKRENWASIPLQAVSTFKPNPTYFSPPYIRHSVVSIRLRML